MERGLDALMPATRWVARRLDVHAVLDSTNRVAEELARAGAPDGTVVIAERQTAGRGRQGRSFFSPTGGLYLSLLLRPRMPADRIHHHVFAAAVAVAQAAAGVLPASARIQIKWPNDVWVEGRKVSGINLPVQLEGERVASAVLGVGVNVNTRPDEFPEELRALATSLCAAAGHEIDRTRFAERLLEQLERWIDRLRAGDLEGVLEAWRSRLALLGARVRIAGPGVPRPREGIARGVDAAGALLLETPAGLERILAGDVNLVSDGS
jgi:BirA family transcriptional regulator, biotin operon repressor / biotin---[acetyl-CoA-carboxylase] ligase